MRRSTAQLAFAFAVLASGDAGAQEPDPRAVAEARQAFERGVQRMRRERWAEAEVEFRRSLDLHPTQVAAFNLGLCAKEQGHPAEALDIFERFLVEFGDEASPARRAEVEHEIEVLRTMPGQARIFVDVDGADVFVDGRPVGTSPLEDLIDLPGGPHDFEARLAGYPSAMERAVVRPESATEVHLALGEPTEATAQVDSGPSGIRPVFFWAAAGVAAVGVLATAGFGLWALDADAEYRAADVRTAEDRRGGERLVILADVSLGLAFFAATFAGIFYSQTDWSQGVFRLGFSGDSAGFGGTF